MDEAVVLGCLTGENKTADSIAQHLPFDVQFSTPSVFVEK